MPRYYFNFEGRRPHDDRTGEVLRDDEAAWREAVRLVRDVEDRLQPGDEWKLRVLEEKVPVFVLTITTRRCRDAS
jgi:hypothetical protein